MALNSVHNLDTVFTTVSTTSVGGTPVTAYTLSPLSGRLLTLHGILRGAITTADGLITVNNVTTGIVWGTMTITQSGSAAGISFTGTPTTYASSLVSVNDVLSLVPTLASGSTIGMDYRLSFRSF